MKFVTSKYFVSHKGLARQLYNVYYLALGETGKGWDEWHCAIIVLENVFKSVSTKCLSNINLELKNNFQFIRKKWFLASKDGICMDVIAK